MNFLNVTALSLEISCQRAFAEYDLPEVPDLLKIPARDSRPQEAVGLDVAAEIVLRFDAFLGYPPPGGVFWMEVEWLQ